MNNSSVIFDSLFIGRHLEKRMDDFSSSEVQFFSYLGCLLCLYDGKTTDDWNYKFIKSSLASPYSADIHLAFETLLGAETLVASGEVSGYYKVSEKGIEMLEFYETLSSLSWRKSYLQTACNSLSVIPLNSIKAAIEREPVLSSANNSLTRKNLLDECSPATQYLHAQFASLKAAIHKENVDLIVPASIWITSLIQDTETA